MRDSLGAIIIAAPARIAALLKLNYLISALIIVMVTFTALAWHRNWWNLAARLHYSVITLAAALVIPALIYWRLLGFGY